MKKFKRAFTLAELLLCIGIIGIVSAMGMVITKHTTDKAYQLYYYTGYINLYNAIAEAKLQGATNATDTMSKAMDLLKVDNTTSASAGINVASNCDLNLLTFKAVSYVNDDIYYMKDKLETGTMQIDPRPGVPGKPPFQPTIPTLPKIPIPETPETPTTPETPETPETPTTPENPTLNDAVTTAECANGITYSYNIPLNVENSSTENTMYKNVFITMRVPAAKTRTNNGFQEVRLYYSYDSNTLIPLAPEEGSAAPDLQTRRDLLPAYIDDGKVGRNNVVDRTNFTYEKPIYGSFKDAFCSLKGTGYEEKYGSDITVISCATDTYTDIRKTENGTRVNGVLKIASPQKAH